MVAYLKFADAAAWQAAYRAHLAKQVDGAWRPHPGVQIDEIGVIHHETGTRVVKGITVPVMTARPGWHVNVIADDIPAALYPYCVNPAQPKRVMFGAQVLSMPETLPEAGGTVMIERGVGQAADPAVVAQREIEALERRVQTAAQGAKGALNAKLAAVRERLARLPRGPKGT